jgi:hypothetical protein
MKEEGEKTPDWWDELSESQKAQINEGLHDAKNGRTMSSEEFWWRLKNSEIIKTRVFLPTFPLSNSIHRR